MSGAVADRVELGAIGVAEQRGELQLKLEFLTRADRVVEEWDERPAPLAPTTFRDVRADGDRRASHLGSQSESLGVREFSRQAVDGDRQLPCAPIRD
jgi:hypothetical protein